VIPVTQAVTQCQCLRRSCGRRGLKLPVVEKLSVKNVDTSYSDLTDIEKEIFTTAISMVIDEGTTRG
jgi:hypothetical protein